MKVFNYVVLASIVSLCLFLRHSFCEPVESETSGSEEPASSNNEYADLTSDDIAHVHQHGEKHSFQAEVDRMMKLIINSLYRNKEIFLRELISNASDALDKIRQLALSDSSVLGSVPDYHIHIKADAERHTLTITDTGIGMTKADLINNLGTIAKSGTAEFLSQLQESGDVQKMSDLIGQFGVGFYSTFLVADKVIVRTKHNDDDQHIWESDSNSFSVARDPQGNTLGRGTAITLVMKEEAFDYLEEKTISELIKRYSQFINFKIYLWTTTRETVEEPVEEESSDDVEVEKTDGDDKAKNEEDGTIDEDAAVEDADDSEVDDSDKKPKTRKVERVKSDWQLTNENKPIWTRKPAEIADDEYAAFYKSISKDTADPLTWTHFVAEGEVTFKSLLFVPNTLPSESFNKYGTSTDNIKLYVRRVFITDDFNDMLPNYLAFLRGLIDSDDLPLNVSRETLQQHKLLKVIKKKLVRKALDMFKKMDKEKYDAFWKEYSTNIKLGVLEDSSNKSRLAKLLRFLSSNGSLTSLAEYVERMKDKQEQIFFMAGPSVSEVKASPFVERLLKKGYEVLYLTEAVDEYAISALPEFEGKKFQNVAKEGFSLDSSKSKAAKQKELAARFEPLTKWMADDVLKEHILRAEVSERLDQSPCALITSRFGWTANMQRIVSSQTHAKTNDMQRDYYLSQKKALEINPRHPLIKELLKRVEDDPSDESAKAMAHMMFDMAVLRSGYQLKDTAAFATHVEGLMRQTLGIDTNAPVDVEEESPDDDGDDDDNETEDESNDNIDEESVDGMADDPSVDTDDFTVDEL